MRLSLPRRGCSSSSPEGRALRRRRGISDPSVLDDARLREAVEVLAGEEHEVSAQRGDVHRVLDALQDELKRRYKEDPSLAFS